MAQELGPLAKTLALPYYEEALPAHDEFHANRVRDLSLRLAADLEETINEDVLAAAAWLHDIGRPIKRMGKIDDHDEWATRKAEALLTSEGILSGQIDAIKHCIRAHSIRVSSPNPETIEAKLLFDADKLDATGAVGITRLACIVGERSGRTSEKYSVIDDLTVSRKATSNQKDVSLLLEWARERLDELHTEPAQQLGESSWEYMQEFFEEFHNEIGLDGTR